MTEIWEYQEEFDSLYNQRNINYLGQLAKLNGSMQTLKWLKSRGREEFRQDEKKDEKYALLERRKDWTASLKDNNGFISGKIDMSRLVELLILSKMTGFHWGNVPFVIKDNVPLEFAKLVALHEIIEIGLAGVAESCTYDISYRFQDDEERGKFLEKELKDAARYPHERACEGELEIVFFRGEEFARRYANWLMETNSDLEASDTFFNQAIPGFLKENGRMSKNPLEILIEFYAEISQYNHSSEYQRKMIAEDWSWMEKYFPVNVVQ